MSANPQVCGYSLRIGGLGAAAASGFLGGVCGAIITKFAVNAISPNYRQSDNFSKFLYKKKIIPIAFFFRIG